MFWLIDKTPYNDWGGENSNLRISKTAFPGDWKSFLALIGKKYRAPIFTQSPLWKHSFTLARAVNTTTASSCLPAFSCRKKKRITRRKLAARFVKSPVKSGLSAIKVRPLLSSLSHKHTPQSCDSLKFDQNQKRATECSKYLPCREICHLFYVYISVSLDWILITRTLKRLASCKSWI